MNLTKDDAKINIKYLFTGIARCIYNFLFYILNNIFRFRNNSKGRKAYLNVLNKTKLSKLVLEANIEIKKNGYFVLDGFFDDDKQFNSIIRQANKLWDSKNYINTNDNNFNHEKKLRISHPLSNINGLVDLVFNETIIGIVSHYKKIIPFFVISMYKTVPFLKPIGSSNFHQDQFGDFSIFIVLHDITLKHGPTQYIKGSHNTFFKFTDHYFFKWLFSKISTQKEYSFYEEENVKNVYEKNQWKTIELKKGSIAMLDVTGIHRGPHWNSEEVKRLERKVIHIVGREKVINGSGDLSFQKMKPLNLKAVSNPWAEAAIEVGNFEIL